MYIWVFVQNVVWIFFLSDAYFDSIYGFKLFVFHTGCILTTYHRVYLQKKKVSVECSFFFFFGSVYLNFSCKSNASVHSSDKRMEVWVSVCNSLSKMTIENDTFWHSFCARKIKSYVNLKIHIYTTLNCRFWCDRNSEMKILSNTHYILWCCFDWLFVICFFFFSFHNSFVVSFTTPSKCDYFPHIATTCRYEFSMYWLNIVGAVYQINR